MTTHGTLVPVGSSIEQGGKAVGRLIWVAVGAAGGVYVYRRGQRLIEEAREKGVVGSVTAATGSAAGLAASARSLLAARAATGGQTRPTSPGRVAPSSGSSGSASGAAAARVISRADRGGSA